MRLFLVVLFIACGGPGPAPAPTNTTTAQPTAQAESVEDVATRLGRAALTGDRTTALSLTLTYEDMTAISVKATERSKADWDAEVADFFDKLAREGSEAQPMSVVGAKIVKSGTLKKGEDSKVLRDIDFAFVQLEIQQGSEDAQPRGLPMIFLKTNAGWRFSPRP